jgi:hypothetical protein
LTVPLDYIICNNDMIQITIDPPTICPLLTSPVALVASGISTVNDMAVCLQGDELPPSLQAPMPYMSGAYTVPGMGTVSVTLASSNTTQNAQDSGKPMLLKGQTFQATFTVSAPATSPPPASTPDPVASKTGTAQFITTNTVTQAD